MSKLLAPLWIDYSKTDIPIKNLKERINNLQERNRDINTHRSSWNYYNGWLLVIGSLLIVFALFIFSNEERYKDAILKTEVLKNSIKDYSKYCESCGRNFDLLVKYAFENSQEKNYSFCSDCYSNGKFKEPALTFETFMEDWEKKTKSLTVKEKAKAKKRILKLKRWHRQEYS